MTLHSWGEIDSAPRRTVLAYCHLKPEINHWAQQARVERLPRGSPWEGCGQAWGFGGKGVFHCRLVARREEERERGSERDWVLGCIAL